MRTGIVNRNGEWEQELGKRVKTGNVIEKFERGMEIGTGNGNGEWERGMGTGNGNVEW